MSPHINPLRHETAQWAGKLATITDVLQLWLTVQELWLSLQPVFNSNLASEVSKGRVREGEKERGKEEEEEELEEVLEVMNLYRISQMSQYHLVT